MSIPLHPDWPSFLAGEQDRLTTFLAESNKLEGIQQSNTKGHYQALVESQQKAVRRRAFTPEDLKKWQSLMMSDENKSTPSKDTLDPFREQFFKKLGAIGANYDMGEIVELMAWIVWELEQHPIFQERNGQLARLLVNYVATWHHIPVIIFKSDEQDTYRKATAEIRLGGLFLYLAPKAREAIFHRTGRLLNFVSDSDNTSLYADQAGNKQHVEWHSLAYRESLWRR